MVVRASSLPLGLRLITAAPEQEVSGWEAPRHRWFAVFREAACPGLMTRPPAAAWPLHHPVPEATAPGREDRGLRLPLLPQGLGFPRPPPPASGRGRAVRAAPPPHLSVGCRDEPSSPFPPLVPSQAAGAGARRGGCCCGCEAVGTARRGFPGLQPTCLRREAGRAQLHPAGEPWRPRLWRWAWAVLPVRAQWAAPSAVPMLSFRAGVSTWEVSPRAP